MLIKFTNRFGHPVILAVNYIVEIGPATTEEGESVVYTANGNSYTIKETVDEAYAMYEEQVKNIK